MMLLGAFIWATSILDHHLCDALDCLKNKTKKLLWSSFKIYHSKINSVGDKKKAFNGHFICKWNQYLKKLYTIETDCQGYVNIFCIEPSDFLLVLQE